MVATPDIGETAAAALAAPPSARCVARLPIDAMVPTLMQFGVSENVAGLYREMTAAFGTGGCSGDVTGCAPPAGGEAAAQVLPEVRRFLRARCLKPILA